MSALWVFGYGSLMWRPGFEYELAIPAKLEGYHRSLCIYSWVHRGTEANPGLVFGLDKGGECIGMAFKVASENRQKTIAYLREREQQTAVYKEVTVPLTLEAKPALQVEAMTYIADTSHEQYAGRLPLEKQLEIVKGASGLSGKNPEYVTSTFAHICELGIDDFEVRWLCERLPEN
ncbi:gamma-glutamylcyclotransferase [Polycladidibacter hongkongensis]|uniref:gamma-glutamylcyclotransferase n=1 Tax=Polycladidibacter hongkongensis TaxID=1647556 RepID=UPI00083751DC|nr:gamma-glutamylcyclotransferase [Pseudovibrio hongkongensis]